MACTDCSNNTPIVFDLQTFVSSQCADCTQGNSCVSSKDICYLGANLPCSSIETGDSLEVALQKIDTQICSALGDYASYQFNCLETQCECTITTEAQFVDAITAYACYIQSTLNTFTGTTFVDFQTSNTAIINGINNPGITCTSANVNDEDNISQILTKYCTKFGSIDTLMDMSLVTWNNCFTVSPGPSNLTEGLQALADQICSVKSIAESAITALPTFNNLGTCLSSPGAADSLVNTVEKIKTRLCQSPTYSSNNINWACLSTYIPSNSTLEYSLGQIAIALSELKVSNPTFSSDFVVVNMDNDNVCAGVNVSLATPLNVDRFVASNALDSSPGTLVDKITAGTGVTLDDTTTPGQLIINVTSTDDFTVKADVLDTTPSYLIDKIAGDTSDGITITPTYNGGTEQVVLSPTVDFETLWSNLQSYIKTNSAAQALFCELSAACPTTEYFTLNWNFSNAVLSTGGNNQLIIQDITVPAFPITVLSYTLNSAASSATGVLPLSSTIAGKVFKVQVIGVADNNVTDLTVYDSTIPLSLYSNTEVPIATTNSYTFVGVGGHTYDVTAQTWDNS